MRDRGREMDRPMFATTPAESRRRGWPRARGTSPLLRPLARSCTLQTHSRHASND